MKTLIYQVKVGKSPTFYDTCIKSVADYCKKYGIEHIVQTKPTLKITSTHPQRKGAMDKHGFLPIYEKENAFAYLGEYDKVCVVDADIFIKPSAPNIFSEIDLEIPFAGVRECDMPLTSDYITKIQKFSKGQYEQFPEIMKESTKEFGVPFYNMGLMLMSISLLEYLNGDTPEQFIRRKEFKKFVDGQGHWKWSTDQTLLNYWIKTTKMRTKNLDWKWNALYKAVTDDSIQSAHFVHFFLADKLPKRGDEIPKIVNMWK